MWQQAMQNAYAFLDDRHLQKKPKECRSRDPWAGGGK